MSHTPTCDVSRLRQKKKSDGKAVRKSTRKKKSNGACPGGCLTRQPARGREYHRTWIRIANVFEAPALPDEHRSEQLWLNSTVTKKVIATILNIAYPHENADAYGYGASNTRASVATRATGFARTFGWRGVRDIIFRIAIHGATAASTPPPCRNS